MKVAVGDAPSFVTGLGVANEMKPLFVHLKSFVTLSLTLSPLGIQAAHAEAQWSCLEPALEQELARKLSYQNDLAELVVLERPDFSDVARLAAAASNERFKVRYSRIVWLWQADRSRLSHPDSFWAYSWDDDDTLTWREADQNHVVLDNQAEDLRAQVLAHPDASIYRQYRSKHHAKEPFLSLTTDFIKESNSDRQKVADCY